MIEQNRVIAQRFREEMWTTGNQDIADELCASDIVLHINDPLTPDFGSGPTAVKQLLALYRNAFPDAQVSAEDIITEGNTAVVRWTATATHQGNLGTITPTERQITVTGIDILRIVEGKIQECWVNWDTLGMSQQLGVVAPLAQATQGTATSGAAMGAAPIYHE